MADDQTDDDYPGGNLGFVEADRMSLDPASVFRFQFHATKDKKRTLDGFDQQKLGKWHVSIGSQLPATVLKDKNKTVCGLALGYGVTPEGELLDDSLLSTLSAKAKGFHARAEKTIEALAGRYVVFLHAGKDTRLYFDPGGHLSVVYDAETETVASSTALCLDRPIIPNPPFDPEEIAAGKGVYALGNTPDLKVKVVRANHYLDLNDFQLKRHWPKKDDLVVDPKLSLEERTDLIADRLSQVTGALARAKPTVMPISGGRDSRLQAALCKHELDELEFTYAHHWNWMTKIDVEIGEHVAKRLGVRFQAQNAKHPDFVPAKRWQKAPLIRSWYLASGYFSKPHPPEVNGLQNILPKDGLVLRGGIIDMIRAVWWRSWPVRRLLAQPSYEVEISNIFLGNMDQYEARKDEFDEVYQDWRDSLPEEGKELIHDFMFLEMFYPQSWQGYNGLQHCFFVCPAADREIIKLMLSFPVKERFELKVFTEMLAYQAPELSDVPTHFEYRKGLATLDDPKDNREAPQEAAE